MDMLRSCYDGYQVLGDGVAGPYKVRWYFCPDDAEPFPGGMHLFGSRNWAREGPASLGLGEPWDTPQIYNKGSLPGPVTGKDDPCGELDWFKTGVPVGTPPLELNSNGLPLCCFPEPPPVCQPFFDGTLLQNASVTFSWPVPTMLLVFQDQADVEFLDGTFSYFLECNATGLPCGDVEGTQVPLWILPGLPTVDEFRFDSYDPDTQTGTYQAYNGGVVVPGFQIFFHLPDH
jgi:hypothetical protein